MVFLQLTSIAFKRHLKLVTKPCDPHIFICLLPRRISIEMPHAKMNKKRGILSLLSKLNEGNIFLVL